MTNAYWNWEPEPVKDKENTRVQSVRCYSPAYLILLMEGTGFIMHKIQYKGKEIDFESDEIRKENAFDDTERNFYYTAIIKRKTNKI